MKLFINNEKIIKRKKEKEKWRWNGNKNRKKWNSFDNNNNELNKCWIYFNNIIEVNYQLIKVLIQNFEFKIFMLGFCSSSSCVISSSSSFFYEEICFSFKYWNYICFFTFIWSDCSILFFLINLLFKLIVF